MEADRGILLQELPHQRGFVRKAVFLFHVIHPPREDLIASRSDY